MKKCSLGRPINISIYSKLGRLEGRFLMKKSSLGGEYI